MPELNSASPTEVARALRERAERLGANSPGTADLMRDSATLIERLAAVAGPQWDTTPLRTPEGKRVLTSAEILEAGERQHAEDMASGRGPAVRVPGRDRWGPGQGGGQRAAEEPRAPRRTRVLLPVSTAAFTEIEGRLVEAGYLRPDERNRIAMEGIELERED